MEYVAGLDITTILIQSSILVVVIAKTIRLAINVQKNILPFFFALAMSSYLLSNFYWIAYELLEPEARMPMACNEIGECAMILLLCAGLETILKDRRKIAREITFATLFISANIALWIAWSGEWFQDILFGIPYIYFFWLLIRGLFSRECLSRKEMGLAVAASITVLAMQIPLLLTQGIVIEITKVTCFTVMYALAGWLGVKSFRHKDFFLAATFFMWTELSMFLSNVPYYYIGFSANTIALLIMYSSMKKELANDG